MGNLKNSTIILDYIVQTIQATNTTETFAWSYNTNGIENDHKRVLLRLENGSFQFYCNNWDRYSVGNTEVKITQAKAIQIAKEEAMKTYSMASSQIIDNAAMVTLSMQSKGNYTLYPQWDIRLPFDKVYDAATNIHASVWADTGEINYLKAVGSGGVSQEQNAIADTGMHPQASLDQWYVIVSLLAVALISMSFVIRKRRA